MDTLTGVKTALVLEHVMRTTLVLIALFFLATPGTTQTQFELSCVQAPRVGRIVFSSGATGQENVYVMNEDGTRVIRLTNNPENNPVNARSYGQMGNSLAF